MEELLFQAVLEILAGALPEAAVFTERVRQGYEGPAVFAELSECRVGREMGNRFRAEGEFALRADPGREDALAGAEMLARLEAAFRGKRGIALSGGKVNEDGTAEISLRADAVGFWQEDGPPQMGSMTYSLLLGGGKE